MLSGVCLSLSVSLCVLLLSLFSTFLLKWPPTPWVGFNPHLQKPWLDSFTRCRCPLVLSAGMINEGLPYWKQSLEYCSGHLWNCRGRQAHKWTTNYLAITEAAWKRHQIGQRSHAFVWGSNIIFHVLIAIWDLDFVFKESKLDLEF